MTRYLTCAETAKLIRTALKRSFPGVKFGVRSHTYSGGASIDVSWIDGPTQQMVEKVAGAFAGSRFDGMIDLKTSVTHYLTKDGRAFVAEDGGTTDFAGTREGFRAFKPTPDAERVSFGADYVFYRRDVGEGLFRRALEKVARYYGLDIEGVQIVTNYRGAAYIANDRPTNHNLRLSELVQRELNRRCAWVPKAA